MKRILGLPYCVPPSDWSSIFNPRTSSCLPCASPFGPTARTLSPMIVSNLACEQRSQALGHAGTCPNEAVYELRLAYFRWDLQCRWAATSIAGSVLPFSC